MTWEAAVEVENRRLEAERDKLKAELNDLQRQIKDRLSHPEDRCHRCGGPNLIWFAQSPLWNAVMRGGSIDGPWEFGEMICPTCFMVLAEERAIAQRWRVTAEVIDVPLQTVSPSGRVWDEEQFLWVDP